MGQLLKWTKAEKEKVIRLAGKGFSTTEIARELGKTRNAVIGFTHRNGIKLLYGKVDVEKVQTKHDAARRRREALEKRKQTRHGAVNWNLVKKKFNPKPPTFRAEPVPPSPESHVKFMDLQYFHCRAVIGNPNGVETVYCGSMKMLGKSWCEHHHKLYFVPHQERVRTNAVQKDNSGSRINF